MVAQVALVRDNVVGGLIMTIATFEGIVEHGQIHLKTSVRLPERLQVFVVVPDYTAPQTVHVDTPRLVHPEQVQDFVMEISKETPDVGV